MASASMLSSVWADTAGKKILLVAENAIIQSRCAFCNVRFSPVTEGLTALVRNPSGTNIWNHGKGYQHYNRRSCFLARGFCVSSIESLSRTVLASQSIWRDGFNGVNSLKGGASRIRFTRACSTQSPVAEASLPAPKVSRPSVTWGVIQNHEQQLQARENVFEYLKSEGINASQLTEIELPSTMEVVKERLTFLRKLGLDNKAINSYPLMIGCSVKKNMIPVLDYLEKLGIERRFLPIFLKKYPMVLHASVVIDLLPVIDYLRGLDIDKKDIASVLLRFPDVLGFKLEGTMSTSVAYLVSIGVNMKEIGPILTEYPEILGMRVASIIKPKVDYLISLGLPKSIVAKVLERRPQLLGYALNETMRPVVDGLLRAGVQKERLSGIIAQYPELLGQCLERSLDAKIEWLTTEVKVHSDDIPRIIEKLPQVLSINERLALERIRFLRKAGFSTSDVTKMVADCPQILALSIDQALKPNLDFLQHDMRRTIKELVDFPAFLTYSLETRIRPRYRLVTEKGMKCSLAWFLNCSDQRFKERMEADFVDDEDSRLVFKMGGPLPVGFGKYGKDRLDVGQGGLSAQKMYARERDDLDKMNPVTDRCESEDEDYESDEEESLVVSQLPGQDDEFSESSADSWDEEDELGDEEGSHEFYEEAGAVGD